MTGHGESRYGVKVDLDFTLALMSEDLKPRNKILKEFAWLLT